DQLCFVGYAYLRCNKVDAVDRVRVLDRTNCWCPSIAKLEDEDAVKRYELRNKDTISRRSSAAAKLGRSSHLETLRCWARGGMAGSVPPVASPMQAHATPNSPVLVLAWQERAFAALAILKDSYFGAVQRLQLRAV